MTKLLITIPQTTCEVLDASISTTDKRHSLWVWLKLRGIMTFEIFLADSLLDLMFELTSKLGIKAEDAERIINFARGEPAQHAA